MITKTFTHTYPNEPWNPSVSEGKTVEVTWKGIRYHIFSRDADGNFFTIEDSDDNLDRLKEDLSKHEHEGHTFHILDAMKHPHVAAYLWGDDTIPAKDASGGIPDYKFETPGDDDDYVFEYNTQNFVMSLYDGSTPLKYDVASDTFTMPSFNDHPIAKSDIFDSYDAEAARIEAAVADRSDEFTAAEITAMNAQATWLKGVRTAYANIDTWKIPHKELDFTWE
tara:strand:+ start:105 stop:773 length:669 start_codon:yes stop_codon:yes gene_type:complete